jgi:pimeloyl-ACP methyl ester carboxylesterase
MTGSAGRLLGAVALQATVPGPSATSLNPWWWGLAGAGVLLGGLVLVLDRMALAMIRPPKKIHARKIRDLPFGKREHHFISLGQPLKGWFVDPEKDIGGPVVVLVHGWGSSHGRMTILATPLLEAGYPVFLFDVRHHGEAPDAPFVTARHFRDDTRAAIREVKATFPDRAVVLMGHSMGGSAAVLAAAEGAAVDGLVSVAAPADLWSVWSGHFDRRGLPGRWMVRLLNPFWRYRAGVPFRTLSPEKRAKEVRTPFLALHGDRDASVPVSHAHVLAREAGVEAVVLEGEGHNDILSAEILREEILEFLEGISPQSSPALEQQTKEGV